MKSIYKNIKNIILFKFLLLSIFSFSNCKSTLKEKFKLESKISKAGMKSYSDLEDKKLEKKLIYENYKNDIYYLIIKPETHLKGLIEYYLEEKYSELLIESLSIDNLSYNLSRDLSKHQVDKSTNLTDSQRIIPQAYERFIYLFYKTNLNNIGLIPKNIDNFKTISPFLVSIIKFLNNENFNDLKSRLNISEFLYFYHIFNKNNKSNDFSDFIKTLDINSLKTLIDTNTFDEIITQFKSDEKNNFPKNLNNLNNLSTNKKIKFLRFFYEYNLKNNKQLDKILKTTASLCKSQQNNQLKGVDYKNFISKLLLRYLLDKTEFSFSDDKLKESLNKTELLNILKPLFKNEFKNKRLPLSKSIYIKKDEIKNLDKIKNIPYLFYLYAINFQYKSMFNRLYSNIVESENSKFETSCVEEVLLNLLKNVLYNHKTNSFEYEKIKKNDNNISKKVHYFFKKNNTLAHFSKPEKYSDEWMNILSLNVEDVTKYGIVYGKKYENEEKKLVGTELYSSILSIAFFLNKIFSFGLISPTLSDDNKFPKDKAAEFVKKVFKEYAKLYENGWDIKVEMRDDQIDLSDFEDKNEYEERKKYCIYANVIFSKDDDEKYRIKSHITHSELMQKNKVDTDYKLKNKFISKFSGHPNIQNYITASCSPYLNFNKIIEISKNSKENDFYNLLFNMPATTLEDNNIIFKMLYDKKNIDETFKNSMLDKLTERLLKRINKFPKKNIIDNSEIAKSIIYLSNIKNKYDKFYKFEKIFFLKSTNFINNPKIINCEFDKSELVLPENSYLSNIIIANTHIKAIKSTLNNIIFKNEIRSSGHDPFTINNCNINNITFDSIEPVDSSVSLKNNKIQNITFINMETNTINQILRNLSDCEFVPNDKNEVIIELKNIKTNEYGLVLHILRSTEIYKSLDRLIEKDKNNKIKVIFRFSNIEYDENYKKKNLLVLSKRVMRTINKYSDNIKFIIEKDSGTKLLIEESKLKNKFEFKNIE